MSKKKLALIIFGAFIFVYMIMFLNTNSLINEVRDVMKGNVPRAVTENTPLSMYNFSDDLSNAEVDVSITRRFVLHNFFSGTMWVNYTYETTKNDLDLMPGAYKVPSCWKIRRENGKWKIVEIIEGP